MNIEGIIILSQTELFNRPVWVPIVIIVLLAAAIGFIIYGCEEMSISSLIAALVVFIGAVGLTIEGTAGHFDLYSGRYEYKCLIGEDVSMSEIYDKYKVVDKDGEIWVLEDKE